MKLLVFMRKDLGMSPGKMAVQFGHASQYMTEKIITGSVFLDEIEKISSNSTHTEFDVKSIIRSGKHAMWMSNDFAKICLEVPSKGFDLKTSEFNTPATELAIISATAISHGFSTVEVIDKGRTEIPEDTLTCVGALVPKDDKTFKDYNLWKDKNAK